MAIWRKCFIVAILLFAARSSAQELVKVPVQILIYQEMLPRNAPADVKERFRPSCPAAR